MQHQVKELEDKYKDIAQLKNMKEQVEDLKKERVWAEVFETEKVHCLQNITKISRSDPYCISES